jgi:hypothetical protein
MKHGYYWTRYSEDSDWEVSYFGFPPIQGKPDGTTVPEWYGIGHELGSKEAPFEIGSEIVR